MPRIGIKIGLGINYNSNKLFDNDMKYPLETVNLSAGENTVVTTTLTNEPYSVELIDSSGNIITEGISKNIALSGGVYVVTLYSVDALSNVKLKIIY